MSNSAGMGKDLVVVSSLKGLVSKEVDLVKVTFWKEFEAISLIPTSREAIKGNLSPNAVGEIQIGKLFFHGCHHVFAHVVLKVKLLVVIAFLARAVATNGGNIEHSTAKLDERSSLTSFLVCVGW